MTTDDAKRVSDLHEREFGVPGCMGCLDCMHVYWRLCPTAWHGQCEGKEGCSSIVLEGMTDDNTWFWHRKFGFPSTMNDINIWNQSTLLRSFLSGEQHNIDFRFVIAGKEFNLLWLLVDGIYPELARFVKPYSEPLTPKQKRFKKWQEASRKSAERAFGTIQRKFQILARPIQLWDEEDIRNIVTTCVIFHNMMVEVRMENDKKEESNMHAEGDNRPVNRRSGSSATGPQATAGSADGVSLFEQTYQERIKVIQETWPDPTSDLFQLNGAWSHLRGYRGSLT